MEIAGRQAECPSCGGPIEWKLGSSAAAVCPWCRSSVVRTDRDLRAIGKVADLVPTSPVMAVGDLGTLGETGFLVAGRIQLDHGQGPWDEWYVGLDGGRWGWLAKAQGRWYSTFPVEASGLPAWEQMTPGHSGWLPGGGDREWTVTERGESRVVSAEGELPHAVVAGERGRYVDLHAPGGGFATIDYGDGSEPPMFFVGRQMEPGGVRWREGGQGPRPQEKVDVSGLRCPTCGGPVPILVPEETERAACPSCHSLLDFQHGALRYLGQLDQPAVRPLVPLGATGTLRGEEVLCIGFMERCTVVDGVVYAWREYLLHTAQGYVWLLEDSGHWTLVRSINPADVRVSGTTASFGGRTHRLFSTASTSVRFVVGEFYWKVEVGEQAQAADYIAPPHMLSEERSGGEVQWSAGAYLPAAEVWSAFRLPGEAPRPYDVAPSQPNPVRVLPWVVMATLLALLLAGTYVATRKSVPVVTYVDGAVQMPMEPDAAIVARGSASTGLGPGATPSLTAPGASMSPTVTPPFQVPPQVDALKVAITSDLGHGWLGMAFALVHEGTGRAIEFTLEQDRFHGAGSARGGGVTSSAVVGGLEPGTYVLRIDPRWARKAGADAHVPPAANLRVSSANPEDEAGCCCLAMGLILLPVPFTFMRKRLFESRRWRSSNLV